EQGGEDLLPLGLDRYAIEDVAAVDVHVVQHAAIDVVVGGKLDRRGGLAAVGRAAPGREAQQVAAAGHLAGRRHRIVAGRVHVDEALGRDRLGVAIDLVERGGAALGGGAQRLLENGGEAPGRVVGTWVVVHRPIGAGGS